MTGKFGSGTVFKTRLVNALLTDDGKVYVGAVTEKALLDAANKRRPVGTLACAGHPARDAVGALRGTRCAVCPAAARDRAVAGAAEP